MANEIVEVPANEPTKNLTPERVQQIFELNKTMDDMVALFMGMLTRTLDTLPDGLAKVAFMNKLQNEINKNTIEVRGKAK